MFFAQKIYIYTQMKLLVFQPDCQGTVLHIRYYSKHEHYHKPVQIENIRVSNQVRDRARPQVCVLGEVGVEEFSQILKLG